MARLSYARRMMSAASRFLDFLRGAAFACAALSCGFAVLSQLGRWSDKADGFTHLAVLWFVGGLAAMVAWMLLGSRGAFTPTLAAAAVLSAGSLMAPEILAAHRIKPAQSQGETLKIIQFNLFQQNFDVPRTIGWIRAQDADLIVTEEVGFISQSVLAALEDMYPYRIGCRDQPDCSTQILSKRPPLAERPIKLDQGNGVLAWAQFEGVKGLYSVIGVHYVWPAPASYQRVNRIVMARNAGRFPKDSLIIAGDFNSTPWSFALRRQDRELGLERRTRALPTWPARFLHIRPPPFLPLDHVYAGRQWRTVSVERGPRLGSDHFPVVVTLTR